MIDFMITFSTEEVCLEYLIKQRWGKSIYCLHCNGERIYSYKQDYKYRCYECWRNFNPKTGTIFHRTYIELPKWFLAIYLLLTNRKGTSSIQLKEQLGITQKTAWFMNHRIRQAFLSGSVSKSKGIVEVDETFVGGKEKNKHADKIIPWSQGGANKDIVAGAVRRVANKESHSIVRAEIIPNTRIKTLKGFIGRYADPDSVIISDDHKGYIGLSDYKVKHSKGEYVISGNVHINSIENFWSLFKRGYVGIYHYMSRKHLQRYLNDVLLQI